MGPPRNGVVLLLLLVTSLIATSAPVGARAPPRAACGVCTDALAAAAAAHGVTVARGRSTMTVQVHANDSTTWTARVELEAGAAALRNSSLRGAVVGDALDRARTAATPTGVSSHLDGSTLVVSYRDDGAAERRLGVVRFTAFHASDPWLPFVSGGEGTRYLGADRVVVRAPPGYVVSGGGSHGNATARRWSADGDPRIGIDRGTVVSFVPAGDRFGGLRTFVANLVSGG